jgi:hypothetical protein
MLYQLSYSRICESSIESKVNNCRICFVLFLCALSGLFCLRFVVVKEEYKDTAYIQTMQTFYVK